MGGIMGKICFQLSESLDVPTDKNYLDVTRNDFKEFKKINKDSLSNIGCYVFSSIKKGTTNTRIPIYVGKTTNQDFSKECFMPEKLAKLNNFFHVNKCRELKLNLLYPENSTRKNAKGLKTAISELEIYLIMEASEHHPELINIQKANGHEWCVEGVIRDRDGRHAIAAKNSDFRALIGFSDPSAKTK